MKKLFFFIATVVALSSCSLTTSNVLSAEMVTPSVETFTTASLVVSPQKITYTYRPSFPESLSASNKSILNNAVFEALRANGDADIFVNMRYRIRTTRFLFMFNIVDSVVIVGYPATYKDFREPDQNDMLILENISRSEFLRNSSVKKMDVENILFDSVVSPVKSIFSK